ncbi:MAG: asparagine synthase-related protein [Candidatus Wukongarchaeota archaeon]|nr:asparagine synthetase B [Candidatus Wukongarchaeota archaeon]
MSYIGGIIQKNTSNIGYYLTQIGKTLRHRTLSKHKIYTKYEEKESIYPENFESIKGHIGVIAGDFINLNGVTYSQPLTGCDEKTVVALNGELYNSNQLKTSLKNFHTFRTENDGEIVAHLFESKKFKQTCLKKNLYNVFNSIAGYFSLLIYDRENDIITIGRDPVGIKPLFIGKNNQIIAFTSERKALWKIGLEYVKPVLPGFLYILSRHDFKKLKFSALNFQRPTVKKPIKDITNILSSKLISSIKKTTKDGKKTALCFSGGLDSSITAKTLQMVNINVELFCVSVKNHPDEKNAKNAAEKLNLPLNLYNLTFEEVESKISEIIWSIEEINPLKVNIAIPLFFLAREAKKAGFNHMILGQGADELFAGYKKYQKILQNEEVIGLKKALEKDTKNLWNSTLQTGDMATMAHTISPIYPFLESELISYSMSIPTELKIKNNERKYILRETARLLNLPTEIIKRSKKAIQYGSGINKILKKIAKKNCKTDKITPFLIKIANTLNLPSNSKLINT